MQVAGIFIGEIITALTSRIPRNLVSCSTWDTVLAHGILTKICDHTMDVSINCGELGLLSVF